MATQGKARPANLNPQSVTRSWDGWLVTLGTAALLVALALTLRLARVAPAGATPAERAVQADAARWNGLAQMYADQAANRERSRAADAARWNGLAQWYADQAANRERSLAADAARWNGLAQLYADQAAKP